MNHRRVSTLCGRFALRCSVFCFRQPTGMTAWSSTRESHAHLIHAHQLSMSLDKPKPADIWILRCLQIIAAPHLMCVIQSLWHKRLSGLLQSAANTGSKCHPSPLGLSRSDVLQVWALQVFDYRICTACCSCLEKDRCKDVVLVSVLDQ